MSQARRIWAYARQPAGVRGAAAMCMGRAAVWVSNGVMLPAPCMIRLVDGPWPFVPRLVAWPGDFRLAEPVASPYAPRGCLFSETL